MERRSGIITLRLQGQTDIPLNENGRVLAQVTARALQPIPFDLCISSPLQRAKETALLVLGERDIPVITDARIQEIGFGTYEGRRVRDAKGEITDPKFFAFFAIRAILSHRRAERAFRICWRVPVHF